MNSHEFTWRYHKTTWTNMRGVRKCNEAASCLWAWLAWLMIRIARDVCFTKSQPSRNNMKGQPLGQSTWKFGVPLRPSQSASSTFNLARNSRARRSWAHSLIFTYALYYINLLVQLNLICKGTRIVFLTDSIKVPSCCIEAIDNKVGYAAFKPNNQVNFIYWYFII